VVILFCNENGYFSGFLCVVLFVIFSNFGFFYFSDVASCPVWGCHIFLRLYNGCTHSEVLFILTTL
jgi:hypothetical protein